MSALFNQTMTVYNHHYDEDTEKDVWIRTVVDHVQWMHNRDEVSTSNNVQTQNKVESITVDFSVNREKEYVTPLEYQRAEDKSLLWTLDARSGQDMVVYGVVSQELTSEYTISDLRKENEYACIVKSVTDNRHMRRLKHIRVVAK